MLTINHDNYDTWLMLYLDNELTAPERDAVEAFAKANPAVLEELDGLRDTMLQRELPVAMPGKERLLMPELWNEEALTQQQQQMLLLADNELPSGAKVLLENAISGSPLLQKEWDLLQKTKVATEIPVEMPGKDKLFRHERTRVIPFGKVLKFAAAAAILGFGWFFVNELVVSPSDIQQNSGVATRPAKVGTLPMVKEIDILTNPDFKLQQPLKEAANDYAVRKNVTAPSVNVFSAIAGNEEQDNENRVAAVQNESEKSVEIYEITTSREPAEKLVATQVVEVGGIMENEMQALKNGTSIGLAVNAQGDKPLYQDEVLNTDEFTDEGTISIGGARIPKQKIRNVYRNITRPIARTLERGGIQLAYAK